MLVSGDRVRLVGVAMALIYFFFKDTATTEIYTLSLHDALPISPGISRSATPIETPPIVAYRKPASFSWSRNCTVELSPARSEEHTSELQSLTNLVCRLLLEKKKVSE